jgi:hypothetical protein
VDKTHDFFRKFNFFEEAVSQSEKASSLFVKQTTTVIGCDGIKVIVQVIKSHTLFGKKVVTPPLDGEVTETSEGKTDLFEGDNRRPSGSGHGSLLTGFADPLQLHAGTLRIQRAEDKRKRDAG